ncbi:DNA polymerase III subunit alpha [Chlamydiales bacterium SCGC AG-110-M15]|nr:DNA polymerase III subunit alpha [Chlamydiales bacterium SCGC AG-110-M15]
MSWVPLHVHSQYSILEASAPITKIVQEASSFGMPAVALTDYGNLYGAVEFFKACKSNNVKPIIGSSFYVAPGDRTAKERGLAGRFSNQLILLAKNDEGYHNLCKLSSIGHLEGFYYNPRIDKEILKQHKEGLICLSGGMGGIIPLSILEGKEDLLLEELKSYHDLFGDDYYLELQRLQSSEEDLRADGIYQESWLQQNYTMSIAKQEKVEKRLLELSQEHDIPCVATNASHYIQRDDWRAHEVLLNIQSGEPCEIWEKDSMGNNKVRIPNPKRRTFFSHEFYFKSPEQMQSLFHDIPSAIDNTLKVAEKCHVELDFKSKHYPKYEAPCLKGKTYSDEDQKKESEAFLRELCEEGIPKRYTPERLQKVAENFPGRDPMDVVRERLDYELEVILPKGLGDYLLIVWDFIFWAKENHIPVGPGRGSGAGSIILYLIGITDIEPLRFHLFFERFINPERMSYPDIDVDICMDGRGRVIDYTLQKYGKDNIAQIITFGTIKAKMAIKDVGRVLNVPLPKVNAIAKLVPEELNITLDKALEIDQELHQQYEQDDETQRIIDLGRNLEGVVRNTGIHAAGIIICSDKLTDHIPLCRSKDAEMAATQYSMKPVESVGMLKVDFLGLKTLTCIQTAVAAVKESTGIEIDYVNLTLEDEATFNLLNQGETLGVFQLESPGMQELARQLHLDKFEEIIAVVSLYRPGPMDMIPSFIARKLGKEPIEYDHEWLKEILDETYGIMVYQEQVMQIAQKLANYSLGEGDVLRRAMGKKDMEQMAAERKKFLQGAAANDISQEVATTIFDKMEKFAAYGFNKSHAAAYGFLAYVTAYFKANYPREWMAALMTGDRDDTTKVAKFIRECQRMHIDILPPDINEAGDVFVATKQGIRFAMLGIKGIGEGVVEAIVQERKSNGPYKSLHDFIKRIDSKKVGKKAVENLIEAGSFDFTEWSRDVLKTSLERDFDVISKDKKEAASGVISLFSLIEDDEEARYAKPPEPKYKTSQHDLLMKEKELLGFFLTGHPMKVYQSTMQRLCCISLEKVDSMDHDTVFRTAFIVETVNTRIASKSQRKFAILTISDGLESYELPIWPELYDENSHLLIENQLLYAVLQVDKRETNTRLSCRWVNDLTQANEEMMEACDRAYDRAKAMAERYSQNAKERAAQKEQKNKEKNMGEKNNSTTQEDSLKMKMDINNLRLSHVLTIKELFRQHSGQQKVSLDLELKEGKLAAIDIDQNWGVTTGPELKKNLMEIPSVKEVTF